MGMGLGFLELPRVKEQKRAPALRVQDFDEVSATLNPSDARQQVARCMDCGIPFCMHQCPLHNALPDIHRLLQMGDPRGAFALLSATSGFAEITGRICPALCEKACVLNLVQHEPTTNREDEAAIIEAAFREGYITRQQHVRNGRQVAVVGAGPAGLATAYQLNTLGYTVTVFDKNEAAGGLLRYGIPNFKLNKAVIDRRIRHLEDDGITFRYGCTVTMDQGQLTMDDGSGSTQAPTALGQFDAIVMATGTPTARDLNVPGRKLKGVHLALEMLAQQNRVLAGMEFAKDERITAKGKDVLVIGGGDTGSDCIGTAHRQGCKSVTQIEIMPRPVEGHTDPQNPWPNYPRTLKTTSSHEEGCTRRWNINTLEFIGKDGRLAGVRVQEIDWKPNPDGGRPIMVEKGQPEVIKAELCLLAMGFLKPQHPDYPANVFVCGDAANGASLVVRAMASGMETARKVNDFLLRA